MPQEIEVWYIIPALRKALTKAMIEKGMSQKDIAKIMGITEAAVSQYLHAKRASEITFSKKELGEIKKSAEIITKHPEQLMAQMMYLLSVQDIKQLTCSMHKKFDSSLENCETCFAPIKLRH